MTGSHAEDYLENGSACQNTSVSPWNVLAERSGTHHVKILEASFGFYGEATINPDLSSILLRFPSKADAIEKLDDGSEMFRVCCRDHLVITGWMNDCPASGLASPDEERFLRRRRGQVEAEIRGMIADFEIA